MLVAFYLATAVCSSSAQAQSDTPGREQATAALEQAQAAIDEAARRRALWTTAVESLEQARTACRREDFERCARFARTAAEQARLGIAQQSYPPLRQ